MEPCLAPIVDGMCFCVNIEAEISKPVKKDAVVVDNLGLILLPVLTSLEA